MSDTVLPPLYGHVRPVVPADLSRVSLDQLLQWKSTLTLIAQSIQGQISSRKSDIEAAGGLDVVSKAELQTYHRWKRSASLALTGVCMDLQRLKRTLRDRGVSRLNGLRDWRAAIKELANALSREEHLQPQTRNAAADLADIIQAIEETQD